MTQTIPAMLLADSRGLDFLNSIATPVDVAVDWLEDGDGLLDWLQQAQLVPAAAISAIRERALPGELDRLAGQARSLREWFRGFVYEHKGHPLQAAALQQLEPLNQLLKRDEAFSEIVVPTASEAGRFQLLPARRWNSPEALLLPIAEAMAQLVCDEDFAYVKACEGQACTMLFADHTRGHARRWCSMAVCGNRAKQAAHRQRTRPAANGT